jgi:uncharacterized membrane protein
MKKFELNKTYLITLQKEWSEYEYQHKILVTSVFEDRINVLSTEVDSWRELKEIKFTDYKNIEVSKINEQDFSDEYIGVVIDEIEKSKDALKKYKQLLQKRQEFVKNRSFLWKVINYFK